MICQDITALLTHLKAGHMRRDFRQKTKDRNRVKRKMWPGGRLQLHLRKKSLLVRTIHSIEYAALKIIIQTALRIKSNVLTTASVMSGLCTSDCSAPCSWCSSSITPGAALPLMQVPSSFYQRPLYLRPPQCEWPSPAISLTGTLTPGRCLLKCPFFHGVTADP